MNGKLTPKDIYMTIMEKKAPSAADLTLRGDKVPKGKIAIIHIFIGIDETTVNRRIQLGYRREDQDHILKDENAGSSAYGIHLPRQLILVDGESPFVTVKSCPSGDVVRLFARGILEG
jgi:hypothetical protein